MHSLKKLGLAVAMGLFAFQVAVPAAPVWVMDLPAAQVQAKKENKLVLMNFTGSDWCGWCKKLQKEVFSTKEFEQYAKDNVVLVEVDFPDKKPQTQQLKAANEALQGKFKAEGYPTIVVLNKDGKEVWRQVGYLAGGPAAWIEKLNEAKKK